MHPFDLTASVKSCMSLKAYLAIYGLVLWWCFWIIVHECVYHVQAKDGFQFLCVRYWLKVTSQMNNKLCLSCAQTCTQLEIINAPSLSFYSYVESISKLDSQRKTIADNTCILWR